MSTKLLSLVIVLGLLTVAREFYLLRDKKEPNGANSNWWHIYGLLSRLMIVGLTFQLTFSWFLTILMILLLTVGYNIACSLALRQKWDYLSDKGIDKVIGFIYYPIKKFVLKMVEKL